jgi:hypothetical protein
VVPLFRRCQGLIALAAAVGLSSCATAKHAPAPAPEAIDLRPARDAVQSAREAGAVERAPDAFARAQGHLNEAEALAADALDQEKREQSAWLGRLAIVEAECAVVIARQSAQQSEQKAETSQEAEKRSNALIRKHEEDQKRLEEQIASLKRELDFTETEVIRTKARLKGIETKAEAAFAIAEARTLLSRLDEKTSRTPSVQRGQEALQRAETLLREDENYGAAIFFAQKAQDAALKAREVRPPGAQERPAAQPVYAVKVASANLRKGPDASETVIARVPRGSQLKASVARGDWIRVEYAGTTGWIHQSVVE